MGKKTSNLQVSYAVLSLWPIIFVPVYFRSKLISAKCSFPCIFQPFGRWPYVLPLKYLSVTCPFGNFSFVCSVLSTKYLSAICPFGHLFSGHLSYRFIWFARLLRLLRLLPFRRPSVSSASTSFSPPTLLVSPLPPSSFQPPHLPPPFFYLLLLLHSPLCLIRLILASAQKGSPKLLVSAWFTRQSLSNFELSCKICAMLAAML